MLVDAGVYVNTQDVEGRTPLGDAVGVRATDEAERLEMVELLLSCGADPDLKDNYGQTPRMKASLYSRHEAQALIEAYPARKRRDSAQACTRAIQASPGSCTPSI